MTKPTEAQLQNLSQTMRESFTHDELVRLVRFEFDERLEWFTPVQGQRDLTTIVDDLVRYYAAQENGLKRLLDAALSQNPQNRGLLALSAEWAELEFEPIALPRSHPGAKSTERYLAAIIVALAAILAISGAIWWTLRPPSVMPEDSFNIAVAEFLGLDSEGNSIRERQFREAASTVAGYLANQGDTLASIIGQAVTVWGPADGVEPVVLGTESSRADALGADVLLYGQLEQLDDEEWKLSPSFFLTDEVVQHANELRGDYALGTPISYRLDSAASTRDLNQSLEERVEALTQVLLGLSYYAYGEEEGYQEAANIFAAATESEWGKANDETGQEVLFLFLGNAYLKQAIFAEDTPEARTALLRQSRDAYLRATDLNPDYGRGYNGLGAALFQIARPLVTEQDECDWDWEQVNRAGEAYEQALSVPDTGKPASGQVDLRGNVGLGRVRFWQGYCGDSYPPPEWDAARRHYEAALSEFEEAPSQFFDLEAALVLGDLGFMDLVEADQMLFASEAATQNEAEPLLVAAEQSYRRAIDLAISSKVDEGTIHIVSIAPFYLTAICLQNSDAGQRAKAALDELLSPLPNAEQAREEILMNMTLWEECTQ